MISSWNLSTCAGILVPNVWKGTGDIASSPEEAALHADRSPGEYREGIVERVTFHSDESGYTVLRFTVPGQRDLVTVIGRFPEINAGQTIRLTGYWREHPKYGRQFQCLHAQETKPATLTGLEKCLGSGLIKGIGPVTARRIVAHFGLETLDIIEGDCSRLVEVPGIAQKRVAMIEKAWAAQKAIKEVMIFLQGHGVSTTYAVKIYKEYGDHADQRICYAPAFYYTEQALATRLATFVKAPVGANLLPRVQRWIDMYTEKRDITLSPEQRHAVELAATSRLLVLTGGPGCGKTFTTRTIVDLWRAMGKSISRAAPTGRAEQRVSEMTRHED